MISETTFRITRLMDLHQIRPEAVLLSVVQLSGSFSLHRSIFFYILIMLTDQDPTITELKSD